MLSLSDQLDLFNESIAKIEAEVGEERTASIVSESIYAVCTGSNDITNTFFGSFGRQDNISSYTDLMVESASSFIQVRCNPFDSIVLSVMVGEGSRLDDSQRPPS